MRKREDVLMTGIVNCPYCLREREDVLMAGIVKCRYCSYTTKSAASMRVHLITQHSGKGK